MKLKDKMITEIRAALPGVEVNEGWVPEFRGVALNFDSTPLQTYMKSVGMDVDIYTDGPDTELVDSQLQAIIDRIDYRVFETDDAGHARPFMGAVAQIEDEEDVVHLSATFNIRCFRRELALAFE